jgi:hypothetical protein
MGARLNEGYAFLVLVALVSGIVPLNFTLAKAVEMA